MTRKKLAIISSHPIQYNAPMFALLNQSGLIEPKVFYTWSQSKETLFDKDFGKTIQWDIPLLDGYNYEFVENISTDPGPHHRKGIDCPGLTKAIETWGAEAILVFGWNYKAHHQVMKYFKGRIPVYFRGDSTLIDETGGWKQWARRIYLKWIYRNTDYAFYVGKNNKAYFLAHGLKEENLFFAPHAIDNLRFGDEDGHFRQIAKDWRKKLKISDDQIVVLFVGKFESKKNPLILIESAKKLNSTKYQFVFVGNGHLEDEMRSVSASMENIHFLPFQNQSEIPALYHMADILTLPSQGPGETWGLVVNEAMACGKAVLVSTKAGCNADLVKNGVNGYVFPSGNLVECVEALNKMGDREIVQQMGDQSKLLIQKWSFTEIVKSLENHLK